MDLEWLEEIGIDLEQGKAYTGGGERYISALQRFFRSYEENQNKVNACWQAKDLENYMITVHALKSNAKMIGAMHLSKDFEELEMAAKAQDEETIERLNGPALTEYGRLIDGLKPIGEMEQVRAADEISGEVARETADRLLETLDDFYDERSAELIHRLSGYPFRITQREKLKEAIRMVEDFQYEEAAGIIREIYAAIE